MAVDPFSPNVVYASYYPGGFSRSTDYGRTWSGASPQLGGAVWGIAVDPSTPGRVYATTESVWVSNDRGGHWTRLWCPTTQEGAADAVAVDPKDPDVVWMGNNGLGGAPAGIYRSTDAGRHFTKVAVPPHPLDGAIRQIAVDPSDPSNVFVGIFGRRQETFPGALVKTSDGGATWHRVDASLDGAVWAVAVDPADPSVVFAGAYPHGVFRSDDGGEHWAPVNDGLASGVAFDFTFDASGNTVWAATAAGLFRMALR